MRRMFMVLTLGMLVLAACAGASAPAPAPDEKPPDLSGGPVPTAVPTGGPGQVTPDLGQRLIIRVGELELQVTDVAATYRQARELALRLGGYVGDSQFATDASGRPSATVVLRVPADRYDEALDALRPLATKVVREHSQETDVTSQVVDLDARITNLRASETSLQRLMDRATKVSEVLDVQHELSTVREQIEQLTAQKQLLQKQAALSALTVTLETVPQPVSDITKTWDPGADVEQAVAQLVDVAQGFGRALIWLAIVVVPVGLVLVALVAIAWFIGRRLGVSLRRPALEAVPIGAAERPVGAAERPGGGPAAPGGDAAPPFPPVDGQGGSS